MIIRPFGRPFATVILRPRNGQWGEVWSSFESRDHQMSSAARQRSAADEKTNRIDPGFAVPNEAIKGDARVTDRHRYRADR